MSKIELKELQGYVSREEKNGLTQDVLKDTFEYDNGELIWKVNSGPHKLIGKKAGNIHIGTGGYTSCYIHLWGFVYLRSRLVFLLFKGILFPSLDHIDTNSINDKIENLRQASLSENNANKNKSNTRKFTSKYKGVLFLKRKGVFLSRIIKGRKGVESKQFVSEVDAALHYNKLAIKHFGEFARLNIIKPELHADVHGWIERGLGINKLEVK